MDHAPDGWNAVKRMHAQNRARIKIQERDSWQSVSASASPHGGSKQACSRTQLSSTQISRVGDGNAACHEPLDFKLTPPRAFPQSCPRTGICDHRRSSSLPTPSPEKKPEMAALTTTNSSFEGGGTSTTSQHAPFEAEELQQVTAEVVNRDPSFGSFLLNDDFGQRATDVDDDDDLKALDPMKLEAVEKQRDARTRTESAGKGESPSQLEPLLRNPNGATQMFTDMHGVSNGIEDIPEVEAQTSTGMRHLAGLTEDSPRLGVTDWGSGTDGGRSGKLQKGVPYGSFVGV